MTGKDRTPTRPAATHPNSSELDAETDAAAEVDRILMGNDAHLHGHRFFKRGHRELAYAYFRLGSLHGIASADEDLAALRASGDTQTADCLGEACMPATSWQPARHAVQDQSWARLRLAWQSPMAGMVALVLAVVVMVGGLLVRPGTRPAPPPAGARAGAWVSTTLSGRSVGPQARLEFAKVVASRPRTTPIGEPPRTPVHTSSPGSVPLRPPPLPTAAGLVPGPHILVSREDNRGARFTALVATNGSDGWRQLRFQTAPGSQFRSTLWSADQAPCTWRFIGMGRTEPDANEAVTDEVPVAAGERRDMTLPTHDWPILSVEVRGGDRSEGCLLVNQRFVPVESTEVGRPARRPAKVLPSSSPSPSILASQPPQYPVKGAVRND
jgi:hypothetical protein